MKKSIVISLLTVIILFCTAICSFASTGIVTTDTLRLRKDASIDASILALLSIDDEVEILEEKDGWYKVKAEVDSVEYVGYVSADYIKKLQETEVAEPTEENEVEGEQNDTNENTAENVENTETQEEKTMIKIISAGEKVYITPAINSIVLNTLNEEKQVEIVSEVNGWSYIKSGDIKGWVRTEKIIEKEASETEQNNTSSQKTGYISGSSVNFREEANTSGNIILRLTKNTEVKVLSKENSWTKIEYDGKVGYVSTQFVSDKKVETTSRSTVNRTSHTKKTTSTAKTTTEKKENKSSSSTSTSKSTTTDTSTSKGKVTGSEIVAYAKKYLGYKYVYGGETPSGFDCSGFTQYVYKHFGYSISRTARTQSSNGKSVSKSNLQQGDIICFSGSSGSKKITHVGIYIGGGKFIHAANKRKGVIISNVSGDGFYYVCSRRIV